MRATVGNMLRAFCLAAVLLVHGGSATAQLPDATRFGAAMEVGDLGAARRWLAEGLNPDFEAANIGTGLMIGAWEGRIEQMELFLAHGADINHVSRIGEQALMLAAWNGHARAVRWLLERGAKVNREGKQWSALHYATFNGHESVVRFLMARGADVNARTTNDSTALMLSAREGREDIARLLLEAGADPRPANDWGDTAFTWAMSHRNLRIARLVSAALDAVPADTGTPPTFAEAVKAPPETFAEPAGSIPAPPRIAEIMQRLRAAELRGQPTRALRQELFDAVAQFKSDAASPAAKARQAANTAPKALVITARRSNEGRERAELVYGAEGGARGGVSEALARIRAAQARGEPVGPLREALFAEVARFKSGRPAQVEHQARPAEVSEILQQLREAEAAGRPVGELRNALRDAVEQFKRDSARPGSSTN